MKIPVREKESFSEKKAKKERRNLKKNRNRTSARNAYSGHEKSESISPSPFPRSVFGRILYLSVICAWNSCRDCTGSLPSRFALRIPSTVARAMAMVVMYGIRFLIAALRI